VAKRPVGERAGGRAAVVILLAMAVVVVALAGTRTAVASGASPAAAQGCAANPGAPGCSVVSLSISTASLATCSGSCTGAQLVVGQTAELPLVATYSDGSTGPLSVLSGNAAASVTFSTGPQPPGALTLTGLVNAADGEDEIELTADEVTSSPAVVQVAYDGLTAASGSLSAGATATCGTEGLPPCSPVKGALVQVSAQLLTSTASTATSPGPSSSDGSALAVAGAVADMTQGGAADETGAYVADVPCYPDGSSCGAPPPGSPATASVATCTTAASGTCALTAAWDAAPDVSSAPDVVSLYPPVGYVVVGASGCASTGTSGLATTCEVAPAEWSAPLQVAFELAADPVVTVELAGPTEPCTQGTCSEPEGPALAGAPGLSSTAGASGTGLGATYDDAAVNGTTVTVSPAGALGAGSGAAETCQVEGGQSGASQSGASQSGASQPGTEASCSLSLPPGDYEVSVPGTIDTLASSALGIPLAYVTGADPQTVTLQAGLTQVVPFATAYEPTITVVLAGPAEPCDPELCLPDAAGDLYDNDAVDGTTITVTPTGTTGGQPVTCEVANGQLGDDVDWGQEAYCSVNVRPGSYEVTVPSTVPTPDSEVGIPLAYVTGAASQAVSVTAGQSPEVTFTTGYEPTVNVEMAGPLEPGCSAANCPASELMYDNDAVDGVTVTVSPAEGTIGQPQTCQLSGGYPGDNSDYGQDAYCDVNVAPGTYTVTVPGTVPTPDSEVGIPFAYVSGSASQSVTVAAGGAPEVSFSTAYEPVLDVSIEGPMEPGCSGPACGASQPVFDSASVDGAAISVTPAAGTGGSSQTCAASGGVNGDAEEGQPASCTFDVPPGTYSVSVPRRLVPHPGNAWGDAVTVGPSTQVVTVAAGDSPDIEFNTAYVPMVNVGSGSRTARASDGLLVATGTGGTGVLTVGDYASDPVGPPVFDVHSSVDDFFDVSTSPGSTFSEVSFTVCGLHGAAQAMQWWREVPTGGGSWGPVSPSALSSKAPGCLTADLTASSDPGTAALSGTVFAVNVDLQVQHLTIEASKAKVVDAGSHFKVSAWSSSGLQVALSAAGTSAEERACSISRAGRPARDGRAEATVSFTYPGSCDVVATQSGSARWAEASAQDVILVRPARPVAVARIYSTHAGHALSVGPAQGLLRGIRLRGVAVTWHSSPARGRLTMRPNGSFDYVPARSFEGVDHFSYVLSDLSGSSRALVTVRVLGPARDLRRRAGLSRKKVTSAAPRDVRPLCCPRRARS